MDVGTDDSGTHLWLGNTFTSDASERLMRLALGDTGTFRDEVGTFTDWATERSVHWAAVILWAGLSTETVVTTLCTLSTLGVGLDERRLELTVIARSNT